jgi:hypothetical protein
VLNPRNIRFSGVAKMAKKMWMNGIPVNCDTDVAKGVREIAASPERMKYLECGNCSNLSIFSKIILSARWE